MIGRVSPPYSDCLQSPLQEVGDGPEGGGEVRVGNWGRKQSGGEVVREWGIEVGAGSAGPVFLAS